MKYQHFPRNAVQNPKGMVKERHLFFFWSLRALIWCLDFPTKKHHDVSEFGRFMSWAPRMPVTTRITTFFGSGDHSKPSFATVTGRRPNPMSLFKGFFEDHPLGAFPNDGLKVYHSSFFFLLLLLLLLLLWCFLRKTWTSDKTLYCSKEVLGSLEWWDHNLLSNAKKGTPSAP